MLGLEGREGSELTGGFQVVLSDGIRATFAVASVVQLARKPMTLRGKGVLVRQCRFKAGLVAAAVGEALAHAGHGA
jgi:hypothetical protein